MISSTISAHAGVGLKPEHYDDILTGKPEIGFFEIHAENYMGDGGPPHHYLARIREHYPLSLHGVGLSIGADRPLDREHLQRLKALNERYTPGLFSEHLAWSTHDDVYYTDLLPLPYNEDTLSVVCEHIDEVQDVVGRQMLLENPSTYIAFENSTLAETQFLSEIVHRTGCGLLLDVNNVFVSATNHKTSPDAYLNSFPLSAVGEIHLGGHADDTDDAGDKLLIDAHDREVADPVWRLYERVISEIGPTPTLVEWDSDLPAWSVLEAEARRADRILDDYRDEPPRAAAE
ncbi:MAG: DUF692 domain-containing protein [Pseudomonadota bacterium]